MKILFHVVPYPNVDPVESCQKCPTNTHSEQHHNDPQPKGHETIGL